VGRELPPALRCDRDPICQGNRRVHHNAEEHPSRSTWTTSRYAQSIEADLSRVNASLGHLAAIRLKANTGLSLV
jgi:hypothetical protein